MASNLSLLLFPPTWNGALRSDASVFQPPASSISAVLVSSISTAVEKAPNDGVIPKPVPANCPYPECSVTLDNFWAKPCECHKYCVKHCTLVAKSSAACVKQPCVLEQVITPYLDIAVNNNKVERIMEDVARKLNGLDPSNGLGFFHGLLVLSDDVCMVQRLLELGVDPELRSICLCVKNTSLSAKKAEDAEHKVIHYLPPF